MARVDAEGQSEMFGGVARKQEEATRGIAESALFEGYGKVLGGKGRVIIQLGTLARLGFIERRNKAIFEGPLLDLAFDYAELAPRILQGALAEVLKARKTTPSEGA